tara:strand:- start:334 stop:729 length:396 start_codon:yes stop_codon:yes gene_type:complete
MSIINKLFSAGASTLVKEVGDVLDNVITSKDEKLAAELKIKELVARYEADIERNVTERWMSDMNSDSKLSKNIRPLTLIFLVVCTMLLVFIDSGNIDFNVSENYIDLLQIILITTIGAYFGGRTIEKRNNN